mgnify:CR=1 FL=1
MEHQHEHDTDNKNIRLAFFLNLAFTVLELVGGTYVNSVAIISDAIHDLGDSLSLGTAWYLQHKSQQEADNTFSFGYRRFSLFGALITSLTLIGGSVFVIYEAVGRLRQPEPTDADGMLAFAIVGVLVNGFAAWKLSHAHSLNERMISWHLLEDVLGWVAVLVVAIILQFEPVYYLDPALSLLITVYILWNVIRRLRETLFIFLQGVPKGISKARIEGGILDLPRTASVHHMHIWSLDGEQHVFSVHVRLQHIETLDELLAVKENIRELLKEYAFTHQTIEIELDEETCGLEQ